MTYKGVAFGLERVQAGLPAPNLCAAIEQAALDPVGAQPALDGLTLVALRGIG